MQTQPEGEGRRKKSKTDNVRLTGSLAQGGNCCNAQHMIQRQSDIETGETYTRGKDNLAVVEHNRVAHSHNIRKHTRAESGGSDTELS